VTAGAQRLLRPAAAGVALLLVAVTGLGCGEAPRLPVLTVADDGGIRARVSACLGFSFSTAVAFAGPAATGGMSDGVLRCVEDSADCPAVLACLDLNGPPCGSDAAGRCEGAVAVHCRLLPNAISAELREDCGARRDGNTRCQVVDDAGKGIFATCNAGPCQGDRCDDGVLVTCLAGVEIRTRCADQGRVCVTEASPSGAGGSFCALAEPCARDHCEGDTVVLCRAGQVDLRQSCPALIAGGRCRDQLGAVDCAAPAWDPQCPMDQPYLSRCDGDRGLVCHAGARLDVDCPTFLDGRCQMDPTGHEGRCLVAGWP